jgi:hypothetical protein
MATLSDAIPQPAIERLSTNIPSFNDFSFNRGAGLQIERGDTGPDVWRRLAERRAHRFALRGVSVTQYSLTTIRASNTLSSVAYSF